MAEATDEQALQPMDVTFSALVVLPEGAGSLAVGNLTCYETARQIIVNLAENPTAAPFTSYHLELELPGIPTRVPLTPELDLTPLAARLVRSRPTVHVVLDQYTLRSARVHLRRLREVLAAPPVAPPRATVENSAEVASAKSASSSQANAAGKSGALGDVSTSAASSGSDVVPAAASAGGATGEAVVGTDGATTGEGEEEEEEEEDGGPAFTTGADFALFIESVGELDGRALVGFVADQRARAQAAAAHFAALPLPLSADPSLLFPVPNPLGDDVTPVLIGANAAATKDKKKGPRPVLGLPDAPFAMVAPPSSKPASSSAAAASEPQVQCLRSAAASAWNPPPAPRRACGDLLYVRLETLDGEAALHVTATPAGWFVNRSSDSAFDPAPAAAPHASRTLWTLLLRASPAFRRNYQALLVQAAHVASSRMGAIHACADPSLALNLAYAPHAPASATGTAGAGGQEPRLPGPLAVAGFEAPSFSPLDLPPPPLPAATLGMAAPPAAPLAVAAAPWLVEPAAVAVSKASTAHGGGKKGGDAAPSAPSAAGAITASHGWDEARAEADAANPWGGAEPTMVTREWACEWAEVQTAASDASAAAAKASASASDEEAGAAADTALMHARLSAKVLSDFVDAATAGAVAAVTGVLPPLNASDEPSSHVYHHANVFFARVADVPAKQRALAAAQAAKRAAAAASASAGGVPTAGVEAPLDADDDAGVASFMARLATPSSASAEPFSDVAMLMNPALDLRAVCAAQRAGVPGLCAMATAIIDYCGVRVACSSPIPGVITGGAGEGAKLLAGSIDSGATIASDPAVRDRMRALGAALSIAERTVTPTGTPAETDGGDAAAPASLLAAPPKFNTPATSSAGTSPVPLVGPVEAKIVRGSDGRVYLMDWVRSTPRDPRYYGPRVEAAKAAWAAAQAKAAAGTAGGDEAWSAVVAESPTAAAGASTAVSTSITSTAATEEEAVISALHDGCYEAVLRPELQRTYAAFLRHSAARAHVEAARKAKAATSAGGAATATPPGGDVVPAADGAVTPAAPAPEEDDRSLLDGFVPPAPPAYNLNAFTRFTLAQEPAEKAVDEAAIYGLASYLTEYVLPAALRDLLPGGNSGNSGSSSSSSSIPLDGEGLTRLLHARGVNVRCLGELATLARDPATLRNAVNPDAPAPAAAGADAPPEPSLASMFPYVLELLEGEMVARVARRRLDALLREPAGRACPAVTVAGFLSALLAAPAPTAGAGSVAGEAADAKAQAAKTGKAGAGKSKGGKGASEAPSDSASSVHLPVHSLVPVALPASVEPLDDEHGHPTAPTATTTTRLAIPVPRVRYPAHDIAPPAAVATAALEAAGFTGPGASAALWASIASDVAAKFGGYQLLLWPGQAAHTTAPDAAPAHVVNRFALLRRVARRSGLQLAPRRYDFAPAAPTATNAAAVITPDDVLGFAPVIASSIGAGPSSVPGAQEAFNRGRSALALGDIQGALEGVSEAVSLWSAVYGYAHENVGTCFQTLALVLAAAESIDDAIVNQQRALAIFQRVLGPDAAETASAHMYLGQYLHVKGATDGAVRHLARGTYLLQLVSPSGHPDVLGAYIKLGSVLHEAWHVNGAARCFNEAFARALEGGDMLAAASALTALGRNASLVGGWKDAIGYSKRAYAILADRLGRESVPAREASTATERYTRRAVEMERFVKEETAKAQAAQGSAAAQQSAGAGAGAGAGGKGPSGGGKKGGKRK